MADYLQRVRATREHINDIGQGQRFYAANLSEFGGNRSEGFQDVVLENVNDEFELSFYSENLSGIIIEAIPVDDSVNFFPRVFLSTDNTGKVALSYSDETTETRVLKTKPTASILKIKRVSDGFIIELICKNERIIFKKVTTIIPLINTVGNLGFNVDDNFFGFVWGIKKNGIDLSWWEVTQRVEIEVDENGVASRV